MTIVPIITIPKKQSIKSISKQKGNDKLLAYEENNNKIYLYTNANLPI